MNHRFAIPDPGDERHVIAFDTIEVDAIAHRVLRDGKPVMLEPKAYDVLMEFIAHPNELLGRDQLLDKVWGHRHVTPAVLSRVIAQLRKALGDDAAEPHFIQTVHGVGYRFMAPLRRPATTGAHASATDPAKPALEPEHTTESAAHTLVPAVHRGQNDSAVDTTAASRTRPTVRTSFLVGALAIVAVASCASLVWQRDRKSAASALPPVSAASLAVLPFTTRGDDAELRAAGEGLSESLIDAFARVPALRVAGRESAFALARGSANPQKVAERLGVDYALSGEIVPSTEGLQLRIGLWKRGATAPVWLDSHDAPRAQLFRVLVPITDHVRATLAPASVVPVVRDTSVTAQDLYWLGRHYSYQRTPESLARALGYFERAIAEDAAFAPAYCGLADSYMLLFEYGDLSLDEAAAKARAAVAQAKALDPDLADAAASEGLVLLDQGRNAEAVDVLSRAARLAPNHSTIALWYGTALAYAGRPREAFESHRRAAVLDPLNAVVETYIGQDYALLGDREQATAHLRHALELNADYAEPNWILAVQHALHGELADATNVLENSQSRQNDNGWTAYQMAYLDVIAGDGAAAELALESATEISPLERLDVQVRAHSIGGRMDGILEALDRFKPGPSTVARHSALRARSLIALGRDDEARALYDDLFADRVLAGDPFLQLWTADFGFGHYANWLALLPADSAMRRSGLGAYRDQLARLRAGGVNLPLIAYQEAVVAALADDADTAERKVRDALDHGWLDAAALDRDLAWRRYREAPWLESLRARGAELAAKERETLRAATTAKR